MQFGNMKRSVVVRGHKTSMSLENEFWLALREIAAQKGIKLSALIGIIDVERSSDTNLSSAIRLYVLAHFVERASSLTMK